MFYRLIPCRERSNLYGLVRVRVSSSGWPTIHGLPWFGNTREFLGHTASLKIKIFATCFIRQLFDVEAPVLAA